MDVFNKPLELIYRVCIILCKVKSVKTLSQYPLLIVGGYGLISDQIKCRVFTGFYIMFGRNFRNIWGKL